MAHVVDYLSDDVFIFDLIIVNNEIKWKITLVAFVFSFVCFFLLLALFFLYVCCSTYFSKQMGFVHLEDVLDRIGVALVRG